MKDIAEIIIGKHRHGPIGKFYLKFNKKTGKFKNYYIRKQKPKHKPKHKPKPI